MHRLGEGDSEMSVGPKYDPPKILGEDAKITIEPILSEAPGVEDNASGVGTITEILRILMEHDHRPKRTLQFMVYAGEEVGYIGSGEIAKDYKKAGKNVIGVLNFDMTNFRGSDDLDLVIVGHRETTDRDQNAFLEFLTETYLPEISWETPLELRKSDHIPWNKMGFRVSMLTDSRRKERSKAIHSAEDTLEASGGNANHSVNFVKVGLTFLVELGG